VEKFNPIPAERSERVVHGNCGQEPAELRLILDDARDAQARPWIERTEIGDFYASCMDTDGDRRGRKTKNPSTEWRDCGNKAVADLQAEAERCEQRRGALFRFSVRIRMPTTARRVREVYGRSVSRRPRVAGMREYLLRQTTTRRSFVKPTQSMSRRVRLLGDPRKVGRRRLGHNLEIETGSGNRFFR